jgi:hypothetical protein
MKKILLTLAVFLSTAIAGSVHVYAEGTPDGLTPANEGVCDALQGAATPSLYGLCVAFCEAQDHFSEVYPVTEEELANYLATTDRANKIFEKYNARKTEFDPDMPCVVIEQDSSCPCWTEQELDLYTDSTDILRENRFLIQIRESLAPPDAFTVLGINGGKQVCRATVYSSDPVIGREVQLDDEQAESCRQSLRDQAVELGL